MREVWVCIMVASHKPTHRHHWDRNSLEFAVFAGWSKSLMGSCKRLFKNTVVIFIFCWLSSLSKMFLLKIFGFWRQVFFWFFLIRSSDSCRAAVYLKHSWGWGRFATHVVYRCLSDQNLDLVGNFVFIFCSTFCYHFDYFHSAQCQRVTTHKIRQSKPLEHH